VKHSVTPDGRYVVVRGRRWRMTNPGLDESEQADLDGRLETRRAVRGAKKAADPDAKQRRIGPWTRSSRRSASAVPWGGATRFMPTGMRN
jgi:hypothetical protein